ncbi:efflux RND transporter periplasmic adaptor subunit [Staphylococcus sp. IVB6246]|uniref:efflux RND transporter periplasmic adaptor subunit n=1 Tax=unclassified Staphylococcus TaxID=91994 RepID=UPI0021D0223F|nr:MULTISPECIES: efflux RND transporter periplasmic adaptor subunit [unclassified Staphylococcus]UXR69461.1 efflux RND transporter periplasmic adaptor subunit [Staphylococcus sp. IVB6246]UXR71516.1 efflux RND transporter periplasmic adaptor subunit [Staphylococcus sp. IVB6240]UXR73793.1 efflux RND transporter periplasmic adaptor subunit [Staphylococcus sp. IVB6238]
MKKRTLIILAVAGFVLLLGVALAVKAFGGDKTEKDGYDTYQVKEDNPIRVTGKVSPHTIKTYQNNSQLGDFVSVQVEDGQKVQQGTPLINYAIDGAQRQSLVDQVNQAESKGDQNAIDKAWRQLNRYDGQVNNSIYATFPGTVSLKNTENVGDGEPILQLIAENPEIKTTVSEYDLDKIKVGDKVNVEVNSTGKKGTGKIVKISELPTSYQQQEGGAGQASGASAQPAGEEGEEGGTSLTTNNPVQNSPSGGSANETSKYEVIVGDLDFKVRNGYSVEAKIPQETLKLPKSVLTKDDHVYVVDKQGKARKVKVEYDEENDTLIVKKGVKKGDKLIKNPDNKVKDGKKVEVSE